MGRFYPGLIIEALIDDGLGNTKERPAVVVDRQERCNAGGPYLVVAITKSIEDPMPPYHFLVHNCIEKDPVTGLYYPCVAKCNWPREIEERRVIRRMGTMPDDLFVKICDAFDLICDDEDFKDWI